MILVLVIMAPLIVLIAAAGMIVLLLWYSPMIVWMDGGRVEREGRDVVRRMLEGRRTEMGWVGEGGDLGGVFCR